MHTPLQHFLSVANVSGADLIDLISEAQSFKSRRFTHAKTLSGMSIGIFSSKPSLRTRLSFEVGITELGGNAIFFKDEEVGLGHREDPADVIRVLNGYVHAFVARVHNHQHLSAMVEHSRIPIINALSDLEHPCQAFSDALTLKELWGELGGRRLVYVGDGNNVARSLMYMSVLAGIEFFQVGPQSHHLDESAIAEAIKLADSMGHPPPECTISTNPLTLADAVYTDVWVSMGSNPREMDLGLFEPYSLNDALLSGRSVPVLHCLPAHRGQEISTKVFERNAELIFVQAENRLHMQKAILQKIVLQPRLQ